MTNGVSHIVRGVFSVVAEGMAIKKESPTAATTQKMRLASYKGIPLAQNIARAKSTVKEVWAIKKVGQSGNSDTSLP